MRTTYMNYEKASNNRNRQWDSTKSFTRQENCPHIQGYSFSALLAFFWISSRILKWILGVFLDEPSSEAEREEGSKVIRRYLFLTDTTSCLIRKITVSNQDYSNFIEIV